MSDDNESDAKFIYHEYRTEASSSRIMITKSRLAELEASVHAEKDLNYAICSLLHMPSVELDLNTLSGIELRKLAKDENIYDPKTALPELKNKIRSVFTLRIINKLRETIESMQKKIDDLESQLYSK